MHLQSKTYSFLFKCILSKGNVGHSTQEERERERDRERQRQRQRERETETETERGGCEEVKRGKPVAHGPHRSTETQFQSINTFAQSYNNEYTITLIERTHSSSF